MERGAAALVHGQAIALFRTPDGPVHALSNHDPFAHTSRAGPRDRRPSRRRAVRRLAARTATPSTSGPAAASTTRPSAWPSTTCGSPAAWCRSARAAGSESRSGRIACGDPSRDYPRQGSRAVAIAATPSPRPVRPSPSVVVAETEHRRADRLAQRRLGLGPARAEPRPVADDLDRHVADLEAGLAHPPRGLARAASRRPRRPTPAPPYRSVLPRSPRPAAESSASQAAWAATSASEWPSRPCGSSGQASPARCIGTPSTRRWTSVPMPIRNGAPEVDCTG